MVGVRSQILLEVVTGYGEYFSSLNLLAMSPYFTWFTRGSWGLPRHKETGISWVLLPLKRALY